MLNYTAIGTVKREKRGKKVTGTVVWVERYDPVDVTIVYILTLLFFGVCVLEESESLISVSGDLS